MIHFHLYIIQNTENVDSILLVCHYKNAQADICYRHHHLNEKWNQPKWLCLLNSPTVILLFQRFPEFEFYQNKNF